MEFEIEKTSQDLEICKVCEIDEAYQTFKINFLIISFYLLILMILITSCTATQSQEQPKADFFNSFESKHSIKKQFRLDKIKKKGWSLTSNEKTEGDYGLKVRLNTGDKAKGKTERAEIQDSKKIDLDKEVWYRIDFKIPIDFPEVDTRMVFWQLKQDGGNNPLISMRYRNGKLSVKQRFSYHQISYKQPNSYFFEKNTWKRLVIQSYISKTKKGFINIYLDDQLIVSYRGETAYSSQNPKTYFKFGIYRDAMEYPMTIYFDNYIRGKSWQEVVPEGGFVIPDREKLWSYELKTKENE